jgi:hypothetical protein
MFMWMIANFGHITRLNFGKKKKGKKKEEKLRCWPLLFSFLLSNKCESCKGSTILSLSL